MTSVNQPRRTSLRRSLVSARRVKLPAPQRFQPCRTEKKSSSEQPPETPVRPKPRTFVNKIPVILSGIDKKFKTWRSVMGELRQYHPSLKVSQPQVKELPKGDLLVIGDTLICVQLYWESH